MYRFVLEVRKLLTDFVGWEQDGDGKEKKKLEEKKRDYNLVPNFSSCFELRVCLVCDSVPVYQVGECLFARSSGSTNMPNTCAAAKTKLQMDYNG